MALDPALRDRIAASVAEGFAEQVAFTQELIRFRSTAGRGAGDPGFRVPGASASAASPWTASRWTATAIAAPSGRLASSRPSIRRRRSSSASTGRARRPAAR